MICGFTYMNNCGSDSDSSTVEEGDNPFTPHSGVLSRIGRMKRLAIYNDNNNIIKHNKQFSEELIRIKQKKLYFYYLDLDGDGKFTEFDLENSGIYNNDKWI